MSETEKSHPEYVRLRIVPIELKEANAFITHYHRHHKKVQGHRFSISVEDDNGKIHGVCVIGRPVARNGGNQLEVLEVTRLCTIGTKNACSMLYSAAARIGKEMGYLKIQTYILETENGKSLEAAGWLKNPKPTSGGQWSYTIGDGKFSRRTDQPTCPKWKYFKILDKRYVEKYKKAKE